MGIGWIEVAIGFVIALPLILFIAITWRAYTSGRRKR